MSSKGGAGDSKRPGTYGGHVGTTSASSKMGGGKVGKW